MKYMTFFELSLSRIVMTGFAAFILCAGSTGLISPALAQDAEAVNEGAAEQESGITEETVVDDDEMLALKRELALKLHEIRPAGLQVEEAVKAVAERLPYEQRQLFIERVSQYIDLEKLREVSVDAMMEVFTIRELEVMIDYFRTPEARSIAEKMPIYQGIIRPEISKMMDRALLDLRTGKIEQTP